MRLAHLADLHVGFRQFERTTASGRNQREVDVEDAVRRAFEQVAEAEPDVVVVAGDLFHFVKPSNWAVRFLFREFKGLRERLPRAEIVAVAGNHDTPTSADAGWILPLLEEAGAQVVCAHFRRIRPEARFAALERHNCALVCVPSSAAREPVPEPVEDAVNVLVIHGDIPGFGIPDWVDHAPDLLDAEAIAAQGWAYVALGHYHCVDQVRPRMWYAGAVEYVSSNPWAESRLEPKGWLLVELWSSGELRVRHVKVPTRRIVDLPPLYAGGLDGPSLTAAIAQRVDEVGGIDGAVARLVAIDVPRAVKRAIDHAAVRRWKASALSFQLDLRPPESEQSTTVTRARLHASLDQVVDDYLRDYKLSPDLAASRPALREMAAKYLREAQPTDKEPEP